MKKQKPRPRKKRKEDYQISNSEKIRLPSSRNKGIILLVIGSIITVLGGAMIPIGWEARQNAIKTLNGELIPFSIDMSKPFQIAFSPTTSFEFTWAQMENGIDLNIFFSSAVNLTTDQLKIQFIDNKLSVSADIKDSKGTRIAQIVNNEWKTVDPSSLLFWDRNYNAYAFEIIGSNNVPTLHVIMVGPNRIQIGGLFYTSDGRIYIRQPLKSDPTGTGAVFEINPTDQRLEALNISRIFKYPALTDTSNLGKMVNPVYPSSDPLSGPTWIMIVGVVSAFSGPILFAFGFETYKASREAKAQSDEDNKKSVCTKTKRERKPPWIYKRTEKDSKR